MQNPRSTTPDLIGASDTVPLVLAGPMLRQCSPGRLVVWLATREIAKARVQLRLPAGGLVERILGITDPACTWLTVGERLHYLLVDLHFDTPLPNDEWIGYDLALQPQTSDGDTWLSLHESGDNFTYPGQCSPGFILPSRVNCLLHGSCRKPHHPSADGLVAADRHLMALLNQPLVKDGTPTTPPDTERWPSLLMMTGDQVYVDDVAGPMLRAIHQVIAKLGLPNETLPSADQTRVKTAEELYRHPASFYQRETLLPSKKRNFDLIEVLFGGVEKPVFTTDSAHNHLISLSEMLVMYLLAWSPAAWSLVSWDVPNELEERSRSLYQREQATLKDFVAGLASVRRLFAHLPTAMIFDDHDITDDWNLSREWEEVAYEHPFSRRVIGNALVAYLIHQGWGNCPETFSQPLMKQVQQALLSPGTSVHDSVIQRLFECREWHYTWPTTPPLVVIDTRTHRWRSETAARRPSGLMDWEALTDLQQTLKGLPAVLLVSPTPIFGVKLIEVIQRLFTWFGKPLMVDAENWMAHPGAGNAILNIFRHPKTPQHFVVLSGDVHYSFVYDVELRNKGNGPAIWQICSSGLRNTFPSTLLKWLDLANRWLYSPRSPLNWLTRRRRLRIIPRKPEGLAQGRRLLNGSGVGKVDLDEAGVPHRISQILADGQTVTFTRREAESRWE